ncbi:hypothetical protein [Leucobacter sp. W1038]|uniref:hypothetical protein n=1 Tax=Leucobacter sp. W1038 TaxID=3438281 RepID=UPI003D97F936
MTVLKRVSSFAILGLAAATILSVSACITSAPRAPDEGPAPTQTAPTIPASAAELIGVWRAPEPANQNAFVEFTDFGQWRASDGCNNTSGGWTLETDGTFNSLGAGAMTQVGCNNVPIPEGVASAESMHIDANGRLIVRGTDRKVMVLARESTGAPSLVGRWAGPGSASELVIIDFLQDGSWAGRWGCHEFTGTWELGISEDLYARYLTSASLVGAGPVLLSIGSAPAEELPQCVDGTIPNFPLAYDTGYWFQMTQDSFWILPVLGTTDIPSVIPTYYRLAAGEQD